MFEKTPESLLDIKEIKPVDIMGNQPWILVQRTDVEAETPIFWSFEPNSWLIGKFPESGKDWRQKEKRASEAGWPHRCSVHELGQTLGDDEGQRGLACCIPWVAKSQTTLGDWTMIFDLIFFSQSIKCCKEIEKLLHGKCQPSPCKYILSILGVCFTENDFSS